MREHAGFYGVTIHAAFSLKNKPIESKPNKFPYIKDAQNSALRKRRIFYNFGKFLQKNTSKNTKDALN